MTEYPFAVGEIVLYGDCLSTHVATGVVTSHAGPFSCIIDERIFVPVILIRKPEVTEV